MMQQLSSGDNNTQIVATMKNNNTQIVAQRNVCSVV